MAEKITEGSQDAVTFEQSWWAPLMAGCHAQGWQVCVPPQGKPGKLSGAKQSPQGPASSP